MTGTVIVSKAVSFDVRTVDFERIVDSLRSHVAGSNIGKKLLESIDDFGVDMICADELNTQEFVAFGQLMKSIRSELHGDEGLVTFLDAICQAIEADRRFIE